MRKIIFVNDTSATKGGALTILRQFLDGINRYSNKDYIYYVFCSLPELKAYENDNIKIINDIKGKKWWDRIKWDLYGLKRWSIDNNVKADLVFSLQNTGCCYWKNINQIIYIHQSIPFVKKVHFNVFKKEERLLWFYKYIYKILIKISLNKRSIIITQTNAMKNAVSNQLSIDSSRIYVFQPSFENININQVAKLNWGGNKFHIFYPASVVLYKNHEVIIKALKLIKDKDTNEV